MLAACCLFRQNWIDALSAGIGRRPGEALRLPSDLGTLPPALNKFMSGVGALDGLNLEDWGAPGPTMCAPPPRSQHSLLESCGRLVSCLWLHAVC